MVLDTLTNASRYYGMHPLFEQAFAFLRESDLLNLPLGKHELAGQQLFAIISDGKGFSKPNARLEAHRTYIDIQYVVTGSDHMGWKNLAACGLPSEPYTAEKDIAFFPDQTNSWFDVAAGSFTIFFPEDAHAPLATDDLVRKVVLKIAVQ
ncbi:YhcH/YjgK/YiaL family protein [Rufibacter sediminis]|uniref:YhcH/YjgK/YiaL family protein n=1 Tax=Rufibacter sediminis TaxID=2762756 RepID=A0ABR6VMM8_9BACT|nr:YhcH/YjgK/YiaL family protein [Rufibacter sediminis]MBC3538442.1 YhcH/YjgK/YiaL family protein [Rufibacter sediminis]